MDSEPLRSYADPKRRATPPFDEQRKSSPCKVSI